MCEKGLQQDSNKIVLYFNTVSSPPGLNTSIEGGVKNIEFSLSFIQPALKVLTQSSPVVLLINRRFRLRSVLLTPLLNNNNYNIILFLAFFF